MVRRLQVALSIFGFSVISSEAAFVAIDYGSEWTKASLMTPGRPIDVLLNTDSKRKIQSVVAWNKGERSFGTDAFNLAARFPTESFPYLKYLQGILCDGPRREQYNAVSAARLVKDDTRHTCAFQRSDGSQWSIEELTAMQFMYIKLLAEKESGEKITEAVVTVPPFYTQFERQAVIDALQIAGMKPIGLINDGLAVAINYGMARTFSTAEHHIIYDAGASSTTATLVSFSTQSVANPSKVLKSSLKNATHVNVQSFGYDTVANGMELDRRLRDHLLQLFETKHKIKLSDNLRAMARLWKEAGRVKAVLSANKEAIARIESLVEGVDFKETVTQAKFEELAADLKQQFSQPLLDALKGAGMTMENITSVILMGGATRTPMIRSSLQEIAGDKVAVSVNADEAAVLGAAFYGATTKSAWRTKDMRFQDIGAYDVQLKYEKEGSGKQLVTPVFTPRTKMGAANKKMLTFRKRTRDFSVTVAYAKSEKLESPQEIFDVKFSGVANALANLTDVEVVQTPATATFGYSDSGMIVIEDAAITAELKPSVATTSQTSTGSTPASTTGTEEPSASTTSTGPAPNETRVIPLNVTITPLSIPPMSAEQKAVGFSRLTKIVEAENAKARHEEAYNHLEGYLYRLRDLLDGDEESPFKKFAKDSEREALQKALDGAFEWLNDQAEKADATTIWKKRNDLELIESPVIARYKESSAGPPALQDLQKAVTLSRVFVHEGRENRTVALESDATPRFSEEELDSVEKTVNETVDWLKEKIAEQQKLTRKDDPVLKAAELQSRGIELQKLVKGLEKKRPYRAPKPVTTTDSATATESATASESVTAPESATPSVTESATTEGASKEPIRDEL